jgi:peptidoglycan/LPS O-acetylase OafA/YrhL
VAVGPPPVGRYYWKRLLRILPVYVVTVVLALTLIPENRSAGAAQWVRSLTLTDIYLTGALPQGLTQMWSLAVEVSFYIALPFFALAVGRLSTRARGGGWFGVQLAALAVLAVVSVLTADRLGTDLEQVLYLSPIGFGLWFGLGMAMAVLSVRVQQRGGAPDAVRRIGERPLVPWTVAVIIYLVLSLAVLEPISGGQIPHSEIRFVGFGLIAALIALPAVFSEPRAGLPTRILANPVLGWLGLVSYGIFLWHWPIALALVDGGVLSWWPHLPVLVLTTLTLAITLVCAAVSYYLVERPLMRLKYRRGSLPASPEGRPATN